MSEKRDGLVLSEARLYSCPFGGGGGGTVVGCHGRRVLYRLYASMPNDQTLYFGLPECDLMMDQLLDRGMAVSGQESPQSFCWRWWCKSIDRNEQNVGNHPN